MTRANKELIGVMIIAWVVDSLLVGINYWLAIPLIIISVPLGRWFYKWQKKRGLL